MKNIPRNNLNSCIGKIVELDTNCELGEQYCYWIIIGHSEKRRQYFYEANSYQRKIREEDYSRLPNSFFLCLSLQNNEQQLYLDWRLIKKIDDSKGIITCDARWEFIGNDIISLIPYKYDMSKNRHNIFDVTCIDTYDKTCWYITKKRHGDIYNVDKNNCLSTFFHYYNFNT